MVRLGLVLFGIGLLFIAVDVVPFFFGAAETPLWVNLGCLLAPIGFAIAMWSGLKTGRDEQRAAARAVDR
jgi:peptidoglycan/LPS O-acetylase OafA/YrhL